MQALQVNEKIQVPILLTIIHLYSLLVFVSQYIYIYFLLISKLIVVISFIIRNYIAIKYAFIAIAL